MAKSIPTMLKQDVFCEPFDAFLGAQWLSEAEELKNRKSPNRGSVCAFLVAMRDDALIWVPLAAFPANAMTRTLAILCLFVGFLLPEGLLSQQSAPRNFVIFCSPGLSKQQKDQVLIEFQRFVSGGGGQKASRTKGMVPGDTIQVFDAATLNQVTRLFQIPDSARTPNLQFKTAGQAVSELRDFLKNAKADDALVKLPQLVSSFRQKVAAKDAEVLLIGSPLYHDDVAAHDMRQGWLSDGYFAQEPSVTVFSTTTKSGALRNNAFRFCTLTDDIWATENKGSHQEMTQRFWSLFVNLCGGRLVSFQSDIPTAFQSLVIDDLQDLVSLNGYKPDSDDRMEVRSSRTLLAPQSTTEQTTVASARSSSNEAAIDLSRPEFSWLTSDASVYRKAHPSRGKLPAQGRVRVGLTWSTESNPAVTDLDLHVNAGDPEDELSFRKVSTRAGRHYKDFSNPKANHGFELVDLDGKVNPDDLKIWVNAFAGRSPRGFTGEVRVLYEDQLFDYPFSITAKQGNGGADSSKRASSMNWSEIPLSIETHQ